MMEYGHGVDPVEVIEEGFPFIVKVQISLYPLGTDVLVYDRTQYIMQQFPATDEIRAAMTGEPKRYMWARLEPDNSLTLFYNHPCDKQDW